MHFVRTELSTKTDAAKKKSIFLLKENFFWEYKIVSV